ncbi:hypothetical protein PIB30_083376 [Stylosanthes scabra]|uniref:Uncharacterized protein n=1 Tax=Stylosanthes scabra TaxID=79078 RepID=A0ABU6TUD2_9FABA|nr:hypothetical protein [Stylosanthes scabra]
MQVGLETALVAKMKAEEELLAIQEQFDVLKTERDSALVYLPLKEKVDTLSDQISLKEVECQSVLERVSRLEKDSKALQGELKSCRSSLEREQNRADAAEKRAEELSSSLQTSQFDLGASTEMSTYWCTEWKKLATDAQEMCVDFSAITLRSRWDPKGRRVYVPEEAFGDDSGKAEVPLEVGLGQQSGGTEVNLQPEVTEQVPQPEAGGVVDGGGECLT